MRIRYESDNDIFTLETPAGDLFHWPAPAISRVQELPLISTDQARIANGQWVDIAQLDTVTVMLRGEPLRGIADAEFEWLKLMAHGPFSFRDLTGEQFTHVPLEDSTFCSSTYVSMIGLGWVH